MVVNAIEHTNIW